MNEYALLVHQIYWLSVLANVMNESIILVHRKINYATG
jgi:hypothetical protein